MPSRIATPQPVRPAEKGASKGQEHALMRRTVDALVSVTGCRRKEARERIRAYVAGGASVDDLEAYLRQTFRLDPVGVTAVRRAMRGGRDG